MASRRVNAHDIAQAGSISKLIVNLVDCVKAGDMESKEYGARLLRSLTEQPMGPEMEEGTRKRSGSSALALSSLSGPDGGGVGGLAMSGLQDHCAMIADAHGIKPLVLLVKDGSPVAQRDACGALATIACGRGEYQERIIKAGGIPAMAALLRTGDAATQEQAAGGLSSVSQHGSSQSHIISASAIAPLANLLKLNQRHDAQVHAASCVAATRMPSCSDVTLYSSCVRE